jgi:hypothetical protein
MIVTIFVAPLCTFAQTQAELTRDALQLSVSPSYPESNSEYTVTLQSYTVQKNTISWFVNGKEDIENRNKSTLTQKALNPGVKTLVIARITTNDGLRVEKSVTILPSRVDLHVTSDSVVPPFYKGRSLPSNGNTVNVQALVFTGQNIPSANYLYLWRLNGITQNGGAIRGGTSFSFSPTLEKNVTVSVEVQNGEGKVLAQKSQSVELVQPELYFYENNPLRGLSSITLNDPYTFISDEMTIRAEGYFMDPRLQQASILREWKISNKVVTTPLDDPQEIIIRKEGNSGSSKLSFHIRNLQQLLQGVEKSITLRF